MSKNHQQDAQQQADLDAELDDFIKTKKVSPIVKSASDEINLFNTAPQKKKNLLTRLFQLLFGPIREMA